MNMSCRLFYYCKMRTLSLEDILTDFLVIVTNSVDTVVVIRYIIVEEKNLQMGKGLIVLSM